MLCKFPQILSKLRRTRGISQKKAAEELGISPALLSHYENGIRECGLDFLLSLADYYSVSCDYLLGKSDVKNPNLYEIEPEALALDFVIKTARSHSEAVSDVISDVAKVQIYSMIRSLCDTAQRSDVFSFSLEGTDYKNLCPGVAGQLYASLAKHKEKKKLPPVSNDAAGEVVKAAEEKLKEYIG